METLVTFKVFLVLQPIMTETDPKERIKHAAHDLVMKYSVRSVSMDDIAASVGMSKKTLYQYYQDKDELVTAIVDGVVQDNQCLCNQNMKSAKNAVHEVFLTMEMMVEMFQTMNPSVIFEMQKYHPAAYQHFLRHKTQYLLNNIVKNLQRGVQEELYRPEINIPVLAQFRIESMFIPFNPDFQRTLNNVTLLELEEQIITNFLFGVVSLKGYKLAAKYMKQKENKTTTSK